MRTLIFMKINRIMILGNSITLHRPKADIGWLDCWGMAASAQNKDYAHLLLQRITDAAHGKAPEAIIENIAAFEKEYANYDISAALKPYAGFNPEMVILAIGENIPEPDTIEAKNNLRIALNALLGLLKENGNPVIFIRSSFWKSQIKDEILRQLCTKFGGTFVDIGHLGLDEANFARSERTFINPGVANHPGDKGMLAIAEAIWNAIINSKIN